MIDSFKYKTLGWHFQRPSTKWMIIGGTLGGGPHANGINRRPSLPPGQPEHTFEKLRVSLHADHCEDNRPNQTLPTDL
jgi:hypothetical protein